VKQRDRRGPIDRFRRFAKAGNEREEESGGREVMNSHDSSARRRADLAVAKRVSLAFHLRQRKRRESPFIDYLSFSSLPFVAPTIAYH